MPRSSWSTPNKLPCFFFFPYVLYCGLLASFCFVWNFIFYLIGCSVSFVILFLKETEHEVRSSRKLGEEKNVVKI